MQNHPNIIQKLKNSNSNQTVTTSIISWSINMAWHLFRYRWPTDIHWLLIQ